MTKRQATLDVSDHEQRIVNLENALTKIAAIAETVERHEKILKGGDTDSDKGLLERVRGIEGSINNASTWLKAIALMFLGQFVVAAFGVVSFVVKVAPVLAEMAKVK